MQRRSFLQFLGLSPLIAKVVPALIKQKAPEIRARIAVAEELGGLISDNHGNAYRSVRAASEFRRGDVVLLQESAVIGVAINNITKGNYGIIQIKGMTSLRMKG